MILAMRVTEYFYADKGLPIRVPQREIRLRSLWKALDRSSVTLVVPLHLV
jgi:hypothetical protein